MKIEHLAIWVKDLESMKDFYCRYFNAIAGKKYINPKKKLESYFLSFESGSRLELMNMANIPDSKNDEYKQFTGIIHFAISTGDEKKVNELTKQLVIDGFELLDGPRWTGDGYYESVILDPEKNRIEITI
ncbi:MAG: VOC family protein [Flavitalea sp.]